MYSWMEVPSSISTSNLPSTNAQAWAMKSLRLSLTPSSVVLKILPENLKAAKTLGRTISAHMTLKSSTQVQTQFPLPWMPIQTSMFVMLSISRMASVVPTCSTLRARTPGLNKKLVDRMPKMLSTVISMEAMSSIRSKSGTQIPSFRKLSLKLVITSNLIRRS